MIRVLTLLGHFRGFSEYQCATKALCNNRDCDLCDDAYTFYRRDARDDESYRPEQSDAYHRVYGSDEYLSYRECDSDCVCVCNCDDD